jgi:riboflavin synthase
MFTGIISDTAKVMSSAKTPDGIKMVFKRPKTWKDLKEGESVATNGVCLTVKKLAKDSYECDLIPETLDKTTFGKKIPDMVNLERALVYGDRMSGHLVQGHIDEVGIVRLVQKGKEGTRLRIKPASTPGLLAVPKGSVTIDGVSLTISHLSGDTIEVSLVPYTIEHTTLGTLKPGDEVNIEYDILSKYVFSNISRRRDAKRSSSKD